MIQLNDVAQLDVIDGIGVLTINSPPVNALSAAVRKGIAAGVELAQQDPAVAALVLRCAGRTFFAGADISEFTAAPQRPDLLEVIAGIENSTKLVIAALHGTALGGGLEIALGCHYRIAVAQAKLGLPEVNLGLLPGAGGTQRLPRIIGPKQALAMMVSGKPVSGAEALELGLVDRLAEAEADLAAAAIRFARLAVDAGYPLVKLRERDDRLAEARDDPEFFARFRKDNARALKGFKAPENIIKAVEAAVSLPFEQGMKRESALFVELITSVESAAQRYIFFAQRAAAKVPGLAADTPVLPVGTVGVLGAGTMGGGIAMNFLNAGLPVTIVDQTEEALNRGVAVIRRNYEATVAKGRLTMAALEQRMALLSATVAFEQLASCDLIIEAVFENLDLKKRVFAQLDEVAKPDAILASNTSFLDLDQIAAATKRPQSVIGLHFFSPANVMQLLEVVRGAATSDTLVATAMQVSRKIGKTAVLSRVGNGFIANRAMAVRSEQANRLLLHGPMPWDIDRVMTNYGFPLGPFAMTDLVGLDVIGWDPKTSAGASVLELLCEMGRWGQKKNGGYYDYDAQRRGKPSPVAETVIRDFAAAKNVIAQSYSDAEILELLLYPVVNEGTKILQEGIAARASDIDVALTTGYGWPVYTGGPMFWADTVGLARIVDRLDALAASHGPAFAPSALLRRVALESGRLSTL